MLEAIRPGLSETIPGCIRIEPTAPGVLQAIFLQVPIDPTDVLVDIGCGDGGVIDHWLHMGLKNKLIGMELERLTWIGTVERFAGNTQVSIRYGDASKEPPEGTIYYLFNPFRGEQMASFERLVPKTARIVYYNPTELNVFKDWTAKEIWATHPRAVLLSR